MFSFDAKDSLTTADSIDVRARIWPQTARKVLIMANEIVNNGLSPLAAYTQSTKNRLEEARKLDRPLAPVAQDQLELSDAGKILAAEPGFDSAKVDAIRQAIAEGNYPLDSRRMAESFAALEKMMNAGLQSAPARDPQV